jgi:ribosomal protein S18 acetylase RimI-like enzyme
MTDISFIPIVTAEQIAKTAELADLTWTEHYTPIIGADKTAYMIRELQSSEVIRDQIENMGYLYYLIMVGESICGYLALVKTDDLIYLSKIYVEKSFRGLGIARKAIEFSTALCKREGSPVIRLPISRQNLSSIAIYEHLGFVRVKEETDDIGGGYVMDNFIMELLV